MLKNLPITIQKISTDLHIPHIKKITVNTRIAEEAVLHSMKVPQGAVDQIQDIAIDLHMIKKQNVIKVVQNPEKRTKTNHDIIINYREIETLLTIPDM